MAKDWKADKAINELLPKVFADGYEHTEFKVGDAALYVAKYREAIIANPVYILYEDGEAWFASGDEYDAADKLYMASVRKR